MPSKIKSFKLFLILLLIISFGKDISASSLAEFNTNSSSSQGSCIFDVRPQMLLNTNYDIDSAEVDLEVPEASFKKSIQLSNDGTYGYTDTTITAPLPESTKSFRFIATYYMSATGSNVRKQISRDEMSAVCVNPAFQTKQDADKLAQTQKTNTLFSATPKGDGSTIQYGNKSFNIGGVGSALSGCLGVGAKISSALGGLGNLGSISVTDVTASQKESCGDSLAYAASRIIIQNMSKSTINWATSGNNGNPYYPTDYKSLYQNIKSDQVSSFITQLQSAQDSNPYSSAFAKSLASKARSEAESFTEKYKYTGPSASFFKDNSGFNWEDWYKYLQPQNNSLGYSQIATQQIKKLEDQALQATKDELANNSGFLSQKVCDDKSFKEIANDSEKAKLLAAAAKGDKSAITTLGNSVCKNFKISTPGSIIAKQLQDVLGSPLRQTEQVDELNEALGAVFDGIVTKLVNTGLNSLSSVNFKKSVDFSYNGPGNTGTQDLPTGGSFWDDFKTSFDLYKDLPDIIKTQKAYVDQLNKNNQVLELVFKSIDKMDYSLPGPHLGWADGIEQRIVETAANIKQQAKDEMGGALGNIRSLGLRNNILDGVEGVFVKVFTSVLGFYQNLIENKFNPNINVNMPKNSTRMLSMIATKQSYQEIYENNVAEIQNANDVIIQLTEINTLVKALYAKACTRFIKENPGAKCAP